MEKPLERVVVLDFGGQYNQLIARRIRDLGVFSELLPGTISAEKIQEMKPKGIVFSGGPYSVYDEDSLKCDPKILNSAFPFWGSATGCS